MDVGGTTQYALTDQSIENRTLHDFVYNQTEEKLLERRRIKRIPQDFSMARLLSEEVRATLSPVEYVLVRGQLSFSDHHHLTTLLNNFNEIVRIVTRFSYQDRLKGVVGKDKIALDQKIKEEIAKNKLDDNLVKDLGKIFEVFLKDRLIVRVIPFSREPNIRIVGPLQPALLRERLDDIRFKFGTSPSAAWTVFGQIAAVPQREETTPELELAFSTDFDRAVQHVFDSMRVFETFFRVKYPEIAITPIAIYRD